MFQNDCIDLAPWVVSGKICSLKLFLTLETQGNWGIQNISGAVALLPSPHQKNKKAQECWSKNRIHEFNLLGNSTSNWSCFPSWGYISVLQELEVRMGIIHRFSEYTGFWSMLRRSTFSSFQDLSTYCLSLWERYEPSLGIALGWKNFLAQGHAVFWRTVCIQWVVYLQV